MASPFSKEGNQTRSRSITDGTRGAVLFLQWGVILSKFRRMVCALFIGRQEVRDYPPFFPYSAPY